MTRVAFIPLGGTRIPTAVPDLMAAGFRVRPVSAADLDEAREVPDVVWLHADDTADAEPAVRRLLRSGSPPVLLTGGAVTIPSLLGLEPGSPAGGGERVWRDADDELFLHTDFADAPRFRGHAAFRRHRLFDGLGVGAFTWWPREGERYRAWTWVRPAWPAAARVVAVERAFIHINERRATIWEYERAADRPPILCIGAHLPLGESDPAVRPHAVRLLHNALRYLAGELEAGAPDLYWTLPDRSARPDETLRCSAAAGAEPLPLGSARLRLPGGVPEDPFTLAGRRALVAGREGSGCDEVWVHPVRALRGFRVVDGEFESAVVTSLGVERTLRIAHATVTERIHVPRDLPAALFEYERAPGGPASVLRLEWTVDFRLMWPYPADALDPLLWRVTESALVIRSARTGETLCFHVSVATPDGATRPVAFECAAPEPPAEARAELQCSLDATLHASDRLLLRIMGRVDAGDDLDSLLAALRQPAALVRARAASLDRLRRERLAVETPDPRVGEAIEWAKARLDSYVVETPGVGRSLVAGYWTSRPGWNDGRPGYAWYFGRDAVWTALASLACGDFDAARDVIAFLGRHQDLTGRILHECTTSGVVHYDAADSTPLFLLLVARYLAWTGDAGFVRAQWDHVRRACAFCLTTDHDGDGLIENARVGHGWIEFGRLGGGTVTYYNAAIWTAALRELAVSAETIGDDRFAAELRSRASTARLALEALFFDPAARRYAHQTTAGESGWVRDFTPAATHAVPLLLGVADADRSASWLDLVASDRFTTDWGVRLVSSDEPDFDPQRYHGGAVWPLFTGWVSWAEYAAGRSDAGYRHWRSNLDLAFERAKGAWDEVLHGTERRAAGVCPDQAWSTAMAVSPLVYGLLGAEPDAPKGRLRLRPQLPAAWDRFEVRNLRMGEASLRLRYERNGPAHAFTIEQEEGAVPVRLIFEPALPGPVAAARVDGVTAQLDPRPFGERVLAPVQLALDNERIIEFDTGPAR
jgi:glycogen debranching enzyme